MPDLYIDVDTAIAVAVNVAPLTDNTDFISAEESIAYNAAGMDLNWNFITSAGVQTQTNVVPTTAGVHDWTHVGNAMYKLEIPASGGTINNDTEGTGWFSGYITGVLNFIGPRMTFRAAAVNDSLIDAGEALATQSQLDGLSNVGSAVHKQASSYVLTTGTQSANTYTSTVALDGVRHEHTDSAGVMELYYEFLIGSGIPSSFQVTGYLNSSNDSISVYGYDWGGAAWVQIGTMSGKNPSTNVTSIYDAYVNMVGSGSDIGKVRIKFHATSGLSSATLAIDQIFVAFSQGSEGYENATIWYDDSASNTNTVHEIDGVPSNPVSEEASVVTLLSQENLNRVSVAPGSAYTMASTYNNKLFYGHGATLALGGQDVDETHFFDLAISGVSTAATEMEFHQCEIGTSSNQKTHYYDCTFDSTVTWTLAGAYHVINCQSGVAGAGSPTFTKTAGQVITAEFRRWSGGITMSGIESSDVMTISGELGTVTLNGSNGTVEIRGTYKAIVDNRTGSPTLNLDGALKAADVASILVDTGQIGTAGAGLTDLGGMSTAMKAEVNTELVDVMETDTHAEITSPPAAVSSFKDRQGWMFALSRNKLYQTTTGGTLRNDADGADIGTFTASDDGTGTRGKWA